METASEGGTCSSVTGGLIRGRWRRRAHWEELPPCQVRKRTTTQVMLSALPRWKASSMSRRAAASGSSMGFTIATASCSGTPPGWVNGATGQRGGFARVYPAHRTSLETTSQRPSLARMRNSRELSTTSSCNNLTAAAPPVRTEEELPARRPRRPAGQTTAEPFRVGFSHLDLWVGDDVLLQEPVAEGPGNREDAADPPCSCRDKNGTLR